MKFITLLKTGCLSLVISTVLLAQEVKLNIPTESKTEAPASSAAVSAPKFSDAELLESFGWFVTTRIGIADLRFSPEQVEAFARGAALAAAGKGSPHNLEAIGPTMDEFIGKRQAAALERVKQSNLASAVKFFSALKKRPGIISLPDGLCYEILQSGTGPNAQPTDSVTINYTGMFLSGQVFDSSERRGEPMTIALNQALPGWSEGMQQINKGSRVKLYIPPQLAYGDEGNGAIPPAASLIFDIEVLDIIPAPAVQN